MANDATLPAPTVTDRPAPSIPSFLSIVREALHLYRRGFWAYFGISFLGVLLFLLSLGYGMWLAAVKNSSFAYDATPIAVPAIVVLASGAATLAIAAAALVDTSGGRATAPESLVLVLRRLPAFLLLWVPASPVIAASLFFIFPGALLYVGFSMLEVVFLAESLSPFAALRRSWRLAWKSGAALRVMAMAVAASLAWAAIVLVSGVAIGVTGHAMSQRGTPDESMMPAPEVLAAWALFTFSLLVIPAAFVLPALIIAKVILYRHAVLLYPPASPRDLRAPDAAQPGTDS